jgi:hypothetical protein
MSHEIRNLEMKCYRKIVNVKETGLTHVLDERVTLVRCEIV